MLAVFIASLVIGLGTLLVQIFGGHDAGHDAGHDVDGHDGPFILLASIRFWAFALLAFGLVGTLLLLFGFAGTIASAIIAGGFGLVSGYVAAAYRQYTVPVPPISCDTVSVTLGSSVSA